MADMLQIGTQAANTFKRALDVTGHNIANVSTEGYSRQRAEISSNTPNVVGQQFLGGGSKVSTIERIQADYIQRQLYSGQSLVDRYDASLSLAKQLEGIVAGNDEGVREFMQRAFDSIQEVSSDPTATATRQMFLDELDNLDSHVSNLTSVLGDMQGQTNEQIKDLTVEINDRLNAIQNVNAQVERAYAVGTQAPNDLLDQRDQAILELSQYIDIKTYPQEDGQVDIFLSGGDLPLLAQNKKTFISAELGPYKDENRTEMYMSISGQKIMISDRIQGGQLGGVLDFRSEMLDKAQNDLGLTLNGMTASMNWQHYQGWDLNGAPGESLFTPLVGKVLDNSNNDDLSDDGSGISIMFNPDTTSLTGLNGTPPYSVNPQPDSYKEKQDYYDQAIKEIGQMQPREYELRFNSVTDQFDVFDRKTNEALGSFDRDGTTETFIDGFEFKGDNGVYSQGDKFVVKPHQDILEDFEVLINDPDMVAARGQSPVETGLIPPGVTGTPLSNSSPPEAAAYGDNTNMANMAGLQSKSILLSDANDQATSTLLGGYSIMSANVGMYVRSSEIQLTAQENVFQQLTDRRDSLSGVSLDEEAANLLRYQQAYEASAQVISTSQSLFQTLLSVVRG
ncbi:flagellar hook-associated protein FlgK [Thiomicrorhabdus indica]|uniref:flagellar hook-associated protein FlgK n=1 Tax=Thiomicrorhabdus indica TaxID=2267253 RepID=UPI002AA7FF1B|nr:flagellar hook-associated protein FlgK [Thiomicrorhabdus indica]